MIKIFYCIVFDFVLITGEIFYVLKFSITKVCEKIYFFK